MVLGARPIGTRALGDSSPGIGTAVATGTLLSLGTPITSTVTFTAALSQNLNNTMKILGTMAATVLFTPALSDNLRAGRTLGTPIAATILFSAGAMIELIVPVTPPPSDLVAQGRVHTLIRKSQVMPVPVLDSKGRPNKVSFVPTSQTIADWGRLRVIFNDVDVTYFWDELTTVDEYSFSDPFGPEAATITFPQIGSYSALGTGDLSWLTDWGMVKIQRVDSDGNAQEIIWRGLYSAHEDVLEENSYGLQINCFGLLHQTQLYRRAPMNDDTLLDIGTHLAFNLWQGSRPHYRFPSATAVTTGKTTAYRGNWESLDEYIRKLLEIAPDWTVTLSASGVPIIIRRSLISKTWNARVGTRGIYHHIVRDLLASPNVFYGAGIDRGSVRYGNAFPFSDGRVYWQPLAYDPDVHVVDEINGGSDIVTSARSYDMEKIRHEIYVDMGQGIDKSQGQTLLEEYRQRVIDPGYTGAIRFEADPEDGSRLDIRDNHKLRYKSYRGSDKIFHISNVQVNWGQNESPTVEVTADTNARNNRIVKAMMEGIRTRVNNPVANLVIGHRAYEQTSFLWDTTGGSGWFPNDEIEGRRQAGGATPAAFDAPAGVWNVKKFMASERDTVIWTNVETFPSVEFCFAIFNLEPSISSLPVNPFGDGAWNNPPEGLVIGWGWKDQPAGYSPGLKSSGGALTGELIDSATWQYTHDDVPVAKRQPAHLWAAFWSATACVWGGQIVRGAGTQF